MVNGTEYAINVRGNQSMNKILTVCPTIRPTLFEDMEESFYDTSSEGNVLYEVSFGTVTEAINFAFNKFPNFDFYHVTNDDVIYHTKQWDIKLANKGKISYGNDMLQGKDLCTFPMIDGDIVRAVGWLQLPILNKYCGDNVWKFIGEQLNILDYHGDVLLKHKWSGANEEETKEDMRRFSEWLPWAFKDCNNIRKALNDIR